MDLGRVVLVVEVLAGMDLGVLCTDVGKSISQAGVFGMI